MMPVEPGPLDPEPVPSRRPSPSDPTFPARAAIIGLAVAAGLLLAVVALGHVRVAAPPVIFVEWRTGIPVAEREAIAARLSLRPRDAGDGLEWKVTMLSWSRQTVRAILTEPAIAGARGLDPVTRQPAAWDTTNPFDRLTLLHPELDDLYGEGLSMLRRRAVFAPVAAWCLLVTLLAMADGRRWLLARIPAVSPLAAGLLRPVLAAALFLVVWSALEPSALRAVEAPREVLNAANAGWVRALARDSAWLAVYWSAALAALVAFGIGVATRASYVAFVACFTLLVLAKLVHQSTHDFGVPLVTLWLLALVPWGSAFSLDETWRRLRGRGTPASPSRQYGLALWVPTLMIGMAYLAAAFAKLDTSGAAWVLGGAVRYHFLEDAAQAPLAWGRLVARSDVLSVLFAAGAIAIEVSVIAAAVRATMRVRLACLAATVALLAGFYVFQGVFWPAWWALLPAFLPWDRFAASLRSRLPALTVVVDGQCPMCRRTARVLHALDWADRLAFADANDPAAAARLLPGVARDAALRHMFVVDAAAGRQCAGYDGYVQLARVLPVGWVAWPLLVLPPVAAAGRKVYDAVAARRRREACSDEVCGVAWAPPGLPVARARGARQGLTTMAAVALTAIVLQQPLASAIRFEYEPFVSDFPMYSRTWPSKAAFAKDFEEEHGVGPAWYIASADGSPRPALVEALRQVDGEEAIAAAAAALAERHEPDERTREALRAAGERYTSRFGHAPQVLSVTPAHWRFDWTAADLVVEPSAGAWHATIDLARGSAARID